MNPPVDAPTSRQTFPVGSIPKWSSAAASFTPPRETQGCSGSETEISASGRTGVPGFGTATPFTVTRRRGSAPRPASGSPPSPARRAAGRGGGGASQTSP